MTDNQYIAKILNELKTDSRLAQIAMFGHSHEQAELDGSTQGRILKGETEEERLARYSRELAH